MELFSLEEDDGYGDLFLTQSSRITNVTDNVDMAEEEDFLGVKVSDFHSPCKSLLEIGLQYSTHYSDISDEEEFPSSMPVPLNKPSFE